MRELTITRTKSFVGCLAKIKIFIEDPENGSTQIGGMLCSKLGELKNGETKTFTIENGPLRVYAIADQLSKDFCNDFYQLPEGEDNICLSGRPRFNPGTGNAFRFDGNPSQASVSNRKRGLRIGLIVMAIALAIGTIVGITVGSLISRNKSVSDKTFSSGGITLTLTSEFRVSSAEGYAAVFDSPHVAVLATKELYSSVEGLEDITEQQYAEAAISYYGLSSTVKNTPGGMVYFEYESLTDSGTIHYFAYILKSEDAFWMVQFGLRAEKVETYASQIQTWASTIQFE